MQRFNFEQIGGFPLTQDRLKWMQDGYIEALNALGSVTNSSEPVVITGVELVSGNWLNGEVSDGWVYHPTGGLVPFIGGVFSSSNRSYYLTDVVTDLEFQNSGLQGVQIKRCIKISAGANPSLRSLSERRFLKEALSWGEWQEVVGVDSPTISGALLEYRINENLRAIDVRGVFSVAAPVVGPAINTLRPFKNLPLPLPGGRRVESVGNVNTGTAVYGVNALNNSVFTMVNVSLVSHMFAIGQQLALFHPDGVYISVKMPPPQSAVSVSFDFTLNY